jgi:hypothetical protein
MNEADGVAITELDERPVTRPDVDRERWRA